MIKVLFGLVFWTLTLCLEQERWKRESNVREKYGRESKAIVFGRREIQERNTKS